jgi:hypothetical protein
MKQSNSYARRVLVPGVVLSLLTSAVLAEDTNPTGAAVGTTQTPAVTANVQVTAPIVKLPYGVEDVLKLSRANIGEEVILNYVQNSGTIYNLAPQDLVYLRDQGVSERVLNAMLNQRKVVEASAQTAAPAVPNAPMVPDASMVPPAPIYSDSAPAPAPAQSAPAASSVYVIPYPQAAAAYYGYYSYPYGYYRPYYSYCSPSVVIGVGYGGHGCYGGHGYYAHGYHAHGGWHH